MTGRDRALLVSIGVGPVAVPTPPLAIPATWVPAVYVPPPLATPTGLVGLSIIDGSVLNWIPTPGCETVIETAPDNNAVPGTWTLRTQTADDTYTLPVPAGTVRWVRIKSVRHGRSSAYSPPIMVAAQIFGAGPGRNLIGNMGFEANTVATPGAHVTSGPLCNLWIVRAGTATTTYATQSTVTGVRTGEHAARIVIGGQAIPDGVTVFSCRVDYTEDLQLVVGRAVLARGWLTVTNDSGLSGCTLTSRLILAFYNKAGALLGSVTASHGSNAFAGQVSERGIVPAGTARSVLMIQSWITNSTGAAQTLTGTPCAAHWDDIEVITLSNLDEDVTDGTTHGRIAMASVAQVGGVNLVGVTVAGSGHRIGDQRNLLPVTFGSVRARWDGLTINYSVPTTGSPATVTINASAATLRAGSASISYSAASVNVTQTRSSTQVWHLYYSDLTSAGGSRALNATTDPNALANADGVIWVGQVSVTVPAAGTGSSGSGENGGGCVVREAFLQDGRTAEEWREGDASLCWTPDAGDHVRACLRAGSPFLARCVRLVMASGSLTLSADTPIDLPDRRESRLAEHMLGEFIRARLGAATWIEPVLAVDDVGWRWVVPLSFGGASFPAGDQAGVLFDSHNTYKP